MLTKKQSLWISLGIGVWLMVAMLIFASRQQLGGFGSITSSWLITAPVVLLLLPLLVPGTNTAYENFKLSRTTSIMQGVFFGLSFIFGIALLVNTNILVNLTLIGVAILSLIVVLVKASLERQKGMKKDVRKVIITLLAFAVVIWLPASLFLNPGWGTLMLLTPYALIALVPLLLLPSNATAARKERLLLSVFVVEVVFLILWASLGFLYVNGGDTDESLGSIVSKLLGGVWERDFLVQLSPILMKLAAWLALSLLPFVLFYKQGKSILFKVVPLGVAAAAIAFCLWSPYADDASLHKQAQPLKDASNAIQKDIISRAGGQLIKSEALGDGLMMQLKCGHSDTCPSVVATWIVPVEKGKEWAFVWDTIQREGYNNPDPVFPCFPGEIETGNSGCSTWGLRKGSEIHISIKRADQSQIPKQDVSPKVWRLVEARLTPYSNFYVPDRKGEVHSLEELNFGQ